MFGSGGRKIYNQQLASSRLWLENFRNSHTPLPAHPVFCCLFAFIIKILFRPVLVFFIMSAMSSIETQDTLFLIQDLTPGLLCSEALPLGGNVFILKKNQTKHPQTFFGGIGSNTNYFCKVYMFLWRDQKN